MRPPSGKRATSSEQDRRSGNLQGNAIQSVFRSHRDAAGYDNWVPVYETDDQSFELFRPEMSTCRRKTRFLESWE